MRPRPECGLRVPRDIAQEDTGMENLSGMKVAILVTEITLMVALVLVVRSTRRRF